MGFETQEDAERWAENVELRADAAREEKMLAKALQASAAHAAWQAFRADNPQFKTGTPHLIELAEAAFKRGYMVALEKK